MKKTLISLFVLISLFLCSCNRIGIFKISGHTYPDANKYSIGNFSYRAGDVNKVCIDYVSGDVTVVQSRNNTLIVEENEKGLSDDQKMHWYLDGHTLRIQFCKSGYSGSFPYNSKKLSVEIPYGIDLEIGVTSGDVSFATDLEVKNAYFGATSGDYHVKSARAGKFEFGATSGSISIEALYADSAEFGSTSGNTNVSLIQSKSIQFGSTSGNTSMDRIHATDVKGGATSGNTTLGFDYCESFKIACTSGNINISRLPSNGASIEFDHTSGELKADSYMVKNKKIVYGAGGCDMDITTTSGNLIINN